MNSESKIVAELWDLFREFIPASRRLEIAIAFLQNFDEYGFDSRDLADIMDEDPHLHRAYVDLYDEEIEEDEEDYE